MDFMEFWLCLLLNDPIKLYKINNYMSTSEILNLTPENVWKYFYELTKIPRPTGQMEEVTQFMINFGKSLNLETIQDKVRSEEHTSELQSRPHLVCRLLLE